MQTVPLQQHRQADCIIEIKKAQVPIKHLRQNGETMNMKTIEYLCVFGAGDQPAPSKKVLYMKDNVISFYQQSQTIVFATYTQSPLLAGQINQTLQPKAQSRYRQAVYALISYGHAR